MNAEMLRITGFKASNGWLERYLRRTPVQPCYKLRGKGNPTIPPCHNSRMDEIRSTASQYESCNIWNMEESGLFFRMDPTLPTCPLPNLEWKCLELNLESRKIE